MRAHPLAHFNQFFTIMACVMHYNGFDASADAQALEEAMKGLGTNEEVITLILSHRTVNERNEIARSYKSQFGKDLQEQLHKELSGKYRQIVEWSFLKPAGVNAAALKKAMKGAGTDENMLIDVLCTASNQEIKKIKEAYQEMYGNSLEADIISETSGDFKRVLVAILQASRETECSEEQAQIDANALYEAGEGKLGTDETTFTRILCTRSREQIRLINEIYTDNNGHDLIKGIEKETSGNYEKALCRIVLTAKSLKDTVAHMLYKSMKGIGTNDDSLIRIVLVYSEQNLRNIQTAFDSNYEKSLVDMIAADTSADYKGFLLSILD